MMHVLEEMNTVGNYGGTSKEAVCMQSVCYTAMLLAGRRLCSAASADMQLYVASP